jgi:hypothetical protein
MTARSLIIAIRLVSVMCVGWSAWVAVSEPLGRPYGQPALVSDQAASRLAPTGFDQAQGAR